jgi:hypothetical protein
MPHHYVWIVRIIEYMHLKRVCIINFFITAKAFSSDG